MLMRRTGFFRVVVLGVPAFLLAHLAACQPPTSFQGEAKFPGGARGCFDMCAKNQMDMASFVYVGDYSTACACKPKVLASARATAAPGTAQDDSEGAAVAAAAGVELQRRRIAEQQRQQQQQQHWQKR